MFVYQINKSLLSKGVAVFISSKFAGSITSEEKAKLFFKTRPHAKECILVVSTKPFIRCIHNSSSLFKLNMPMDLSQRLLLYILPGIARKQAFLVQVLLTCKELHCLSVIYALQTQACLL